MKANDLEKAVVGRFLADPAVMPNKLIIDFEVVVVSSRDFTGVGFLTNFQRCEELKLFNDDVSMRWGNVGARLNEAHIDTGYVIYVDEGYLTTVEGFTYGEDVWPEEVTQVELYALSDDRND